MQKQTIFYLLLTLFTLDLHARTVISGESREWHAITFDFSGPRTGETDDFNPFLNYRLNVTFTHKKSDKTYLVPGFFAADGDAANTSATKGNVWRVYFTPDETGKWTYSVSFRKGDKIAVSDDPRAGESGGFMDGEKGTFTVRPTDENGRDFRAKGRLEYAGGHYLRFAETGEYFLKIGADAPENLLAYADFDGDFSHDGHKDDLVKTWQPHVRDWKEGDPVWKNGKGKGLIGALNYLSSKGMNSISFLTFNIIGDDRNVFPYLNYDERYRMDVSRLAQWEVVFDHAQKLGLFLHFKTQECENQRLLDNGDVGVQRALYYRELIARFAHHLALNWNLGEEDGTWGRVKNGQTPEQRRAMSQYFYDHDPYHHHIVIHNGQWFDDLYGDQSKLTGASLQTHKPDFSLVHQLTLNVYHESEKAGKAWAVSCDEPGDATHALVPDKDNPNHDNARKNALWGNLMAGGWGVEWYFGYAHDHSDLTCQDWRSRENMWDQSRFALDFFRNYRIPFWNMRPNDALSHSDNWVFASAEDARPFYAVVFAKEGGECVMDLPEGTYDYGWFNPHSGIGLTGLLYPGKIQGKNNASLEAPDDTRDWVLLIGPENALTPHAASLVPNPLELFSFNDFRISSGSDFAPAYIDHNNRAMAIDAAKYQGRFAAGETNFPGPSGTYDVVITTMAETDGESTYKLFIDGNEAGEFQNPQTSDDYVKIMHRWKNVKIRNGSLVRVAFNSHSNGKIPEGNGYAFSRGRWRSLAFVVPGTAYMPLVDPDFTEELGQQTADRTRSYRCKIPDIPGGREARNTYDHVQHARRRF